MHGSSFDGKTGSTSGATQQAGNRLYYAWTYQPVSELDPCDGYYPVDVVRHHVLEVLNNFRARHPERSAEVDAAIKRLELEKT